MPVEIVKSGKVPPSLLYVATCKTCGAGLQGLLRDTKVMQDKGKAWLAFECPVCGTHPKATRQDEA